MPRHAMAAAALAHALGEHPALNARLEDGVIVTAPAVHIGLAVDTARGLLVPVLRDADRDRHHVHPAAHLLLDEVELRLQPTSQIRGVVTDPKAPRQP